MASERLAEALRTELRAILDNDGKPFDLQVARHVYDFAIAAKDLLTVSVKSVEDAMRVIADNKGAMESLTGPDDAPPPEVASETFGARILRELFAMLADGSSQEQRRSARARRAIADARERGMPDLASKLEQRLIGTSLEPPKITRAEVVDDSYEHGFIDGSMQDNFDRGTVNGHCARRSAAGVARPTARGSRRVERGGLTRARRFRTVLPRCRRLPSRTVSARPAESRREILGLSGVERRFSPRAWATILRRPSSSSWRRHRTRSSSSRRS